MGSGHGRQRVAAGTQPAEQVLQANTAGGLSARLRPRTNGPQLAGLAANTTAADADGCRAGKWGECDVLALRKAGSDLPNLSLPQLTPLPVTVPTHSLNLWYPI